MVGKLNFTYSPFNLVVMLKMVYQSLRNVCAMSGEYINPEIIVCNAVLVSHVEESTS